MKSFVNAICVASLLANQAAATASIMGASMEVIMKNMTIGKAMEVLESRSGVPRELAAIVKQHFGSHGKDHTTSHLGANRFRTQRIRKAHSHVQVGHAEHKEVKQHQQPQQGYSAMDGANKMLNGMIKETETNLDFEETKCADFNSKQVELIEQTAQDVASSNAQAAKARGEILRAQTEIVEINVQLPKARKELKENNLKCKKDSATLKTQIGVLDEDLAVMEKIINMSQCDDGTTSLLQCNHTERKVVTFWQGGLRRKVQELRSPDAVDQLQSTLSEAYDETDQEETPVSLAQEEVSHILRKQAPDNTKRCTIKNSPSCKKIETKFTRIQTGIAMKRKEFADNLARMMKECNDFKLNMEATITDYETKYVEEQAALATATKEENQANEQSRLKHIQKLELQAEHDKFMGDCEATITDYKTEICGLKKIRTELNNIQGDTNAAFFTDCEVGPWDDPVCTVTCGGGQKNFTRPIVVHPHGGAPCPPLQMQESCNEDPCPVDCVTSDWSGWSSCSADCGGGVMSKSRQVITPQLNDGESCGPIVESEACNVGSCAKDCVLTDWGAWGECDKACDTGYQYRYRSVAELAEGGGECWEASDPKRKEETRCNMHPCEMYLTEAKPLLHCEMKLDVVLVLDGSLSLGSDGWAATVSTTKTLLQSMQGSSSEVQVAVLLFSGPRTWQEVNECLGWVGVGPNFDTDTVCSMNWVSHITSDIPSVLTKVDSVAWPQGSTLTNIALSYASTELSRGRADANSVVLVLTDGWPQDTVSTGNEASLLKEKTRLMWVPVTSGAPVDRIKTWATQPADHNVITVNEFEELSSNKTINTILADMCPIMSPPR